MSDPKYQRNVGYECGICKAYAGVPDPCCVEVDICDACSGAEAANEEEED